MPEIEPFLPFDDYYILLNEIKLHQQEMSKPKIQLPDWKLEELKEAGRRYQRNLNRKLYEDGCGMLEEE